MAGRAVSLALGSPSLRERFAAAGEREPLSDLAAADRRELEGLLERCTELEDLPGRWQAALLAAEAGAAPGGCCGG